MHGPVLLPWAARLADRDEFALLLGELTWLCESDGASAALRLRWKPGANVRVGAVVPTATGPAAVLVAGFAPGRGKADRLAARGVPVHRDGTVVVVPAHADPTRSPRSGSGRRSAVVQPDASLGRPCRRLRGQGARDSAAVRCRPVAGPTRPGGWRGTCRRSRSAPAAARCAPGGVPGAAPGAHDMPAVRGALHTTDGLAGLPVLDCRAVLAAAQHAGRAVVTTLPRERARVTHLLGVLRRACLAPGDGRPPTSLVHGDFSTDQVVISEGRTVLLDLDRAGRGPSGWDAAEWRVAQIAAGELPLLPPPAASPVLVVAAALLRAPEPFRRLRPAWPQITRNVLDAAGAAALESS